MVSVAQCCTVQLCILFILSIAVYISQSATSLLPLLPSFSALVTTGLFSYVCESVSFPLQSLGGCLFQVSHVSDIVQHLSFICLTYLWPYSDEEHLLWSQHSLGSQVIAMAPQFLPEDETLPNCSLKMLLLIPISWIPASPAVVLPRASNLTVFHSFNRLPTKYKVLCQVLRLRQKPDRQGPYPCRAQDMQEGIKQARKHSSTITN